jgi:integrase
MMDAHAPRGRKGRPRHDPFDTCVSAYLSNLEVYGKATSLQTASNHCNRLREFFSERNPNILDRDEIKRVIDAANKDWLEGVLRVALASGLRNSEPRTLS